MSGRALPPAAPELEERLVASVLETPTLFADVPEGLKPEHFTEPRPRMVWDAMLRCASAGKPIADVDVLDGIRDAMGAERWLREGEAVGEYLRSLYQVATTSMVAKDAARILGRAARRRMIAIAKHIVAEGEADETTDEAFLSEAEGQVALAISEVQSGGKDTCQRLGDVIRSHFARLQADALKGKEQGIRSGLASLDAYTLGFRPGKLWIVGARPGMGKSALMNTFAVEPTQHPGHENAIATMVFSAEMPSEDVAVRAVSSESKIDGMRIQQGRLSHEEWEETARASKWLQQQVVWVDDRPAPTLAYIRSRIRRKNHELSQTWHEVEEQDENGDPIVVKKRPRVRVVVVDYLQIMGVRDRKLTREQQITELADGLKVLGKEEQCAVVALAQLNREVEKRPNKRPMLSDLRESGGIEQAADAILLLYRDEYYNKNSEAKGLCEIIIAKMRGGSTGAIVVGFDKATTRFFDLKPEDVNDARQRCGLEPVMGAQ